MRKAKTEMDLLKTRHETQLEYKDQQLKEQEQEIKDLKKQVAELEEYKADKEKFSVLETDDAKSFILKLREAEIEKLQ